MAGEADLSGCRILVVEDDFHLAARIEHALHEAKAEVLGPVSQEDQALALLEGGAPTCALVDINLGRGVQFRVADALMAMGVPFMFVTGYDDVMIPERFNDIGRMRKPTGFRLVVSAAVQMCSQRSDRGSLQADGPESHIHCCGSQGLNAFERKAQETR